MLPLTDFLSIELFEWLTKLSISRFYRVWSQEGDKTCGEQLARIKVFNEQIDKAAESKSNIIILGDAIIISIFNHSNWLSYQSSLGQQQ